MGSAEDYNRERARLLAEAQGKADFANEVKSKEFMAKIETRRKAVGYKFSEFYDLFMKDPTAAIGEIEKRERRASKRG